MPIAAYPPLGWGRTELLRVPQEMARVDALLDDPVFFAPFAPHFHPLLGRPSTPVECYLRLMFLKFRYRRPPETSPQDYGCAFWGSGPDAKVTIVDPAATPAGKLCPEQPNTEALPCERVLRKGLACQGSREARPVNDHLDLGRRGTREAHAAISRTWESTSQVADHTDFAVIQMRREGDAQRTLRLLRCR